MAEEEKKDSKSKVIIIVLIIVIAVLVCGGTAAAFLLMNNQGNASEPVNNVQTEATEADEPKNPLKLDYDDSAVALDENGLQKQIDEMQKNADDRISLEYKNEAASSDGKTIKCYLANSDLNTEDMFIAIFTDATLTEQVYLSGLLKPGTSIQEFQSETTFEPGEYSLIAMFTSVSDDHETMTSQVSVELKLTVE